MTAHDRKVITLLSYAAAALLAIAATAWTAGIHAGLRGGVIAVMFVSAATLVLVGRDVR